MNRTLYTVNFKKLIKSKWSDCHPNEERGCIGLIIGDNFIQWKEDSGVLIYYINSISEDENKIKLNCEIILASDPIKSTKFHTNIYIELSNNNTIFFRGIKFLKEINSEYEFMPDGFFE